MALGLTVALLVGFTAGCAVTILAVIYTFKIARRLSDGE